VQSVGGSYLPEGSVGSACSVGDSYLKLCWCSGDRCPPKDCHATTTILPRYNNNIATLQQQDCHATATRLPRYCKMSRNGWKMRRKTNWEMSWKIGWKIAPIVQVSSSHYFTDTQHVVRRLEDMVDIFVYSILFIALQHPTQPTLSSSRESPQPFPSHHTLLGTKKEIEYWHDVNSTSSRKY
jgi:hypothetical protein